MLAKAETRTTLQQIWQVFWTYGSFLTLGKAIQFGIS
jgi:hypothetical protein